MGSHIYSIWLNKGCYGGKLSDLQKYSLLMALHKFEVEVDEVILSNVICRICSQRQKGNSIRGNGFFLFLIV